MRLIGTFEDENKALLFSKFLQKKGIIHQLELQKNKDWGNPAYGTLTCQIWIEEEDHLEDVLNWFHLFLEDPENPLFAISDSPPSQNQTKLFSSSVNISPPPPPPSSKPTSWEQQSMGWVTRGILLLCTALFFLSQLWMPSLQIPQQYSKLNLFASPVEKALLYDYPHFYQLIDRFLRLYGLDDLENSSELPPQGQRLLQQINKTLFWPGYYQLLLKGGWTAVRDGLNQYPTFEKIREGEFWRLVSPIFLHGDFFHIFFNMLWLIVLGKQMEQRLKTFRYVAFILIVAIISNTAQYLMSGPNFIGFSGVLCGMLAFIWVRQKWAAWEGYQLDRMTLIFMLVFIIGMALIQFLSFTLEKSFEWKFSPNIANVAHLCGGVVGYFLGRINFFSWRHS